MRHLFCMIGLSLSIFVTGECNVLASIRLSKWPTNDDTVLAFRLMSTEPDQTQMASEIFDVRPRSAETA
jgi:hypothetical protein